jgi:type I restriction enzyme S subunit
MELKKGYKQTEVGVIPGDWHTDKIQNLAQITTGSKNTQDRIEAGEFPFFVCSQTIERINSYSFEGEAVLTAGDGVGTGKVFHYINGKFDFHQRVYKISNFKDTLDGYYFFLYFSNNFYNRIMQMTAKSSVDSVRMEMIADMQIPLPPTKAEQTAIATALSDADALIQSMEKLIAKKRLIKQGAMQELLRPKDGWVTKKLGEIFSITAGGDLRKNEFSSVNDEKYCYPIYSNALTNAGLYGYCSSYDHHGNCITVTARGTVGFANSRDHKFSAIGRLLILKPIEKLNCVFIAEYINLKVEFANESTGIPQLTAPQISKYEVVIPDYTEQTRIATILSDMDAEISALETKLAKYKQIKQGMMQELLTGKTRLI